jgi:hypothetical protein
MTTGNYTATGAGKPKGIGIFPLIFEAPAWYILHTVYNYFPPRFDNNFKKIELHRR